MKNLYDTIRRTAGGYFSQVEIEKFIGELSRWEESVQRFFFQLTQSGDKAKLEFGAHAGQALIDITAEEGRAVTCVMALSSVALVKFEDLGDRTMVTIHPESLGQALSYVAATEDSRTALRSYARYLDVLVSRRA